jgi:hypothetical protein
MIWQIFVLILVGMVLVYALTDKLISLKYQHHPTIFHKDSPVDK